MNPSKIDVELAITHELFSLLKNQELLPEITKKTKQYYSDCMDHPVMHDLPKTDFEWGMFMAIHIYRLDPEIADYTKVMTGFMELVTGVK